MYYLQWCIKTSKTNANKLHSIYTVLIFFVLCYNSTQNAQGTKMVKKKNLGKVKTHKTWHNVYQDKSQAKS